MKIIHLIHIINYPGLNCSHLHHIFTYAADLQGHSCRIMISKKLQKTPLRAKNTT